VSPMSWLWPLWPGPPWPNSLHTRFDWGAGSAFLGIPPCDASRSSQSRFPDIAETWHLGASPKNTGGTKYTHMLISVA